MDIGVDIEFVLFFLRPRRGGALLRVEGRGMRGGLGEF